MRLISILLFLTMIVGCGYAPKKEALAASVPGVVVVGKSIWRFWPGYWSHRIKILDIYIQVKEKEVRLDQLRLEGKKAQKAYAKEIE